MKNGKKKKYKILNFFIVTIVFSIMVLGIFDEFKETKIKLEENEYKIKKLIYENTVFANELMKNEISLEMNKNIEIETQDKVEQKLENQFEEKIDVNYKGYDVVARLEIPKINLKTNVLKDFSKESLNVSVTKFWGPNPNDIGNFCIAGHNFKNKNMFSKLKKIEIGDRIFLHDNTNGKLEYEVYEIFIVLPNDVSCLSQNTEGMREVTLITCTNDSKKRIIVKSREVES